jgi:hypothetical protein
MAGGLLSNHRYGIFPRRGFRVENGALDNQH